MATGQNYYDAVKAALATQIPAGQLFADQMDDDAPLPGVRYVLIADSPDQRLNNGESTNCDFQVDVYANRADKDNAWALHGKVRAALDRRTLTNAGFADIQGICTLRGQPYYEEGLFRIVSRYRFYGSAL